MVHATNIIIKTNLVVAETVKTDNKAKEISRKISFNHLLNHLSLAANEPKNLRFEKISQFMKLQCDKIFAANKLKDLFEETEDDSFTIGMEKVRSLTPNPLDMVNIYKSSRLTLPRSTSEKKKIVQKNLGNNDYSPAKASVSPKKSSYS